MEIQDHKISKKCSAFGNIWYLEIVWVLFHEKPIEVQKAKKPIEFKNSKIKKSKQKS